MKRIVSIIALCFLINDIAFSQVITEAELERQTNFGNIKWKKKAKELSSTYKLNSFGELVIDTILERTGHSKEDLFQRVKGWVVSLTSNPQYVIQHIDKDEGQIIASFYLPNIAKRSMGDNSYRVSIRPVVKLEFKENRVRFTYILQSYEVLKKNDDSGYGLHVGGGIVVTGNGVTQKQLLWKVKDCFPYAQSSTHPEVTSSRALVNSVACYEILCKKVDDALYWNIQHNDW